MHERIPLDLEYKGARTYVQGGDLFDRCTEALRRRLGAGHVAKLALRNFAHHQCDLLLGDSGPEGACGEGVYRMGDGGTRRFWLEETGRSVAGRYPFDEDALLAPATVDEARRTASLPARSTRSPIEEAIALTKLLNYRLMPAVSGKWVFARVDLIRPLEDGYAAMTIRMKSAIPGRFSVNEILLDGVVVGRMDFAAGSP
jgi:hypothetical protein